jgi:hypothetical protein
MCRESKEDMFLFFICEYIMLSAKIPGRGGGGGGGGPPFHGTETLNSSQSCLECSHKLRRAVYQPSNALSALSRRFACRLGAAENTLV